MPNKFETKSFKESIEFTTTDHKTQEKKNYENRWASSSLHGVLEINGENVEVRSHEIHLSEGHLHNYKKETASTSNKKAAKQMEKSKKEVQQLREQGINAFVLNGQVVKEDMNSRLEKDMDSSFLTLDELRIIANQMKADVLATQALFDENKYDRIAAAVKMKEFCENPGIAADADVSAALVREFSDFYEYIIEEKDTAATITENLKSFRRQAGRLLRRDGTMYYSEKKYDKDAREKYLKDEAYYDYIASLEKIEIPKAAEALGISKNKDDYEEFSQKVWMLTGFHLHQAREENKKLDLISWYNETKDTYGDVIFLTDEPIYEGREEDYKDPLFHVDETLLKTRTETQA